MPGVFMLLTVSFLVSSSASAQVLSCLSPTCACFSANFIEIPRFSPGMPDPSVLTKSKFRFAQSCTFWWYISVFWKSDATIVLWLRIPSMEEPRKTSSIMRVGVCSNPCTARHHFFWRTGGVTDWKFTCCVLREGVFKCERRQYLWVSTCKEIVCCQLQTGCFNENKNTKKLIQNTRNCCLQHATIVRFSNFCGWRRIFCFVFLRTQPEKMTYHSQIFARKPDQGWLVTMPDTLLYIQVCQNVFICTAQLLYWANSNVSKSFRAKNYARLSSAMLKSARSLFLLTGRHQEITRVILCRLILNDIIIHMNFFNDIIMFYKIVWHFYVINFRDYVV